METKKKSRVLRTQANFELTSKDMERFSGPSLTLPDESLTVREILERHTRGIGISVVRDGVYNDGGFDDLDMEKVSGVDLVDRDEMAVAAREKREQLEAEYKTARDKEAQEKKEREDEEKQWRDELKERKKKKQDSPKQDDGEPKG